jgi:hypothetical protein
MPDATLPLATARHCKILVVPGAFSLDVFGPLEVFTMGARLWTQRTDWDRRWAQTRVSPWLEPMPRGPRDNQACTTSSW